MPDPETTPGVTEDENREADAPDAGVTEESGAGYGNNAEEDATGAPAD